MDLPNHGQFDTIYVLGDDLANVSESRIDYELASEGRTAIAIHDVSGRRLRVLDEGVREAGRRSLLWDVRDGLGRRGASGVYLLQIVTGADVLTRTAIVAR